MGRDLLDLPASQAVPRFNSRARVGRDAMIMRMIYITLVSTHAPAWGATPLCKKNPAPDGVSTHAPAWGATGNIL